MKIVDQIKADYHHFPHQQSFELYSEDVYFKDPLTEFCGIKRYQQNIAFIRRWFQDIDLTLHEIDQNGPRIETRWTLQWTTPLPWRPRITIPGHSEYQLNQAQQIISHIDYWHCSRWQVIQQHFTQNKQHSMQDK